MESQVKSLTTVDDQDGIVISVVGDTYRIAISGEQTGGAYAVIDMLVPPQGGPGPHAHAAFHEAFYILEGEIEVKTEAQTYTARPGSFVNIPIGGIVHSFKNKTKTTAHMLCIVVPAGLETFFQKVGKPVAAGTFLPPPEMTPEVQEELRKIAEAHGQKIYPPDYLD